MPIRDASVSSDGSLRRIIRDFAEQKRFRQAELERLLTDPEILGDAARAASLHREYREIQDFAQRYSELERCEKDIRETEEIIAQATESELTALAQTELLRLEVLRRELEQDLLRRLSPAVADADRDCILEIRAAAGGEESALFAGDMFRMYSRYGERMGWSIEILASRPSDLSGFREIIAEVQGSKTAGGRDWGPYGYLRFESGVHRVQRIPRTEASGRIHTSTVTVAVLPELPETEFRLDPNELKIEVFRAGGHGGQLVNKIESAVRITHIPTGIQASCQDDRSQARNKAKALRILAARIRDLYQAQEDARISAQRRSMVGTGERSEKIRTYNFPQNRVTDHRIGLTLYTLSEILDGNIQVIHQALRDAELENWLKEIRRSES